MMLDLLALELSALHHEPFEFVVVPEFIWSADAALIRADFPQIDDPGLFPASALSCGPKFLDLLEQLKSREVTDTFSEKFGIDLTGLPLMITVRGQCSRKDGRIHTDSETKVLSALLYFNDEWDEPGGRLRLLKSENIDDLVTEILPDDGTLVAFVRSNHSFHGHLPYVGVRRCIQFNWMISQAAADHEIKRHSWSARTKQFTHIVRSLIS